MTDARDIEMLMFQCPLVLSELRKLTDYDLNFQIAKDIARQIGILRIANDKNHLGFSFKTNLKFDLLLDARTAGIIPGSLRYLEIKFLSHVSGFTDSDLTSLKSSIATYNHSIICRGHDVITLLATKYKNIISKKEFELTLAVYYDITTFKNTKLYQQLHYWAEVHHKMLF